MKVIQKHEGCIGCGSCAIVCPKYWEMGDDMKAHPKQGKKTPEGNYEFEVEEKGDLACNKEAAEVCPVSVIKITDN